MTRRRIAAVLLALAGGLVFAATGSAPAASRAGVSAAFQPFAASFVSASTGFVLGGVDCGFAQNVTLRPCPAVVEASFDGGATWRRLPAPGPLLEPFHSSISTSPSVSAITFADPRNGWLYDGALWATHDGGARWVRIGLKVQVSDVVVAGGWAYAAVPGPVASATAPGAPALLRSPVRRDDWQPVRALPALGASSYPSLLAASGSTVFAAQRSNTPAVWRSAGVAWQRLPSPCSFVTAFDASSSADLAALCPPTLAISTDAGAHARSVHVPTGMPATAQLGIPPGQTNVIVLASPGIANALTGAPKPDALYRSTDGGQHWTRTPVADRGAGFSDLQFVSPTVGWVVHGFPGAASDQLMRTTDAGLTFTPVRF